MPTNGMSKPSSASDGMVCSTLASCNTASAARCLRANTIAAGTASNTAANKAKPESHKCVSSIWASSEREKGRDNMVCLRPPEILPLVMNLESISEWHLFQGLRREKLPASKVSANLNSERQPELWKNGAGCLCLRQARPFALRI